ncbi:hypothetical protein [Clostridium magnum]|uniref:Uncharacterized protein n=1 Tax=Clostridium magnum DSM 2767 TaxID=1121326 RepID=A0A162T253_9CLOT|nr:hypothetical protein [Clostridium magnum]KZL92154.1 hypothetical protein CLMAG_19630 [Clostridium magnum DSM 2767]SHH20130.1 hypothetical protein SAMN02745944_00264 [Clostridium magnum DSM 2767]
MDKTEAQLKARLFGCDREEVDKHIKDIKLANKEKIEELKRNLSAINAENEKLSEEIQKLKDEMKFEMKSEKFMEFVLKKSEEIILIINKVSSDEISRITLSGKTQESIFNKKIEEYNSIIKSTQEDLNILLKKQLKKNEILSEDVKKFIKDKCKCDSVNYDELQVNIQTPPIEYEDTPHTENVENHSGEESFKKSADNYINRDEKIKIKDIVEEHQIDKVENQSTAEIIKSQLKSTDIEEDIDQIRSKYLIGKIAGKDLIDNMGNIIIGKNSIITEQTISKAGREGKLPELIVNMTLLDI